MKWMDTALQCVETQTLYNFIWNGWIQYCYVYKPLAAIKLIMQWENPDQEIIAEGILIMLFRGNIPQGCGTIQLQCTPPPGFHPRPRILWIQSH